jgi:hypothetical protein
MAKKKDANYSIGYKKPPRHSQFKPGQSGNLHGRPKKADSLADVLRKELSARIAIVKDGKRKRMSMLRAIIKQHLTKAANGDPRAAAIIFNTLKVYKPEDGDNLSELVQEFRAIHARHAESGEDDDAKV